MLLIIVNYILVEQTFSTSVLEDILYRFQNRHRRKQHKKSWTFYVDSITNVVCAYITSVDK